jgi:hypothetical protein
MSEDVAIAPTRNAVRKALLALLADRMEAFFREGREPEALHAAGITALVHGGSTDMIGRHPWFVQARGLGDLDLLLADEGAYRRDDAETAVVAFLEAIAASLGGTISLQPDDSVGARRARRRDLESRFGLRSYCVSLPADGALFSAAAAAADDLLIGDEREQLFDFLRHAASSPVDIKVSVKFGNRRGNLRPLFPYSDPASGGAMLALDPRCRLVTKLFYALNPLSPERVKHLCDVALLTGACEGTETIASLDDPWVRKLFLVVFPILWPKPSFGTLDLGFLFASPADAALRGQIEQFMHSGRLRLPMPAEGVAEMVFRTCRRIAGIFGARPATGGSAWTHDLSPAETRYIESAATAPDDGDYPSRLAECAQAMLAEASATRDAGAGPFVSRLVYTVTRFRYGAIV